MPVGRRQHTPCSQVSLQLKGGCTCIRCTPSRSATRAQNSEYSDTVPIRKWYTLATYFNLQASPCISFRGQIHQSPFSFKPKLKFLRTKIMEAANSARISSPRQTAQIHKNISNPQNGVQLPHDSSQTIVSVIWVLK